MLRRRRSGGYVEHVGFHMATEGSPIPRLGTPGRRASAIKLTAHRLRPCIERLGVHTTRIIRGRLETRPTARGYQSSDRRITMLIFQLIHAIVLLATIFLIDKCHTHPAIAQRHEARPLCVGCGDKCDQCEFGFTTSTLCGISECRKGPGQICGGPSESWGVCGDGLICHCNRCTGCSVDNLMCFENTCLPHQSLETRSYLDIFDSFPIDRIAK